jgi:transcriptional regulator with XRE-family HTH domain
MSVGRKIRQLRLESRITQRELGDVTGLAVSYLSRVENGRLTPTLPTLTKVADALSVPLTTLFDAKATLEAKDQCPVSLSGRCLLDHPFTGRGKRPKKGVESYSREQLEALRLCNFLLHTGDKELLRSLLTILKGLLAFKQGADGKSSSNIMSVK